MTLVLRSPLAALYALDAQVLLVGVGYDRCTALHLAEVRSGLPSLTVRNGAPLLVGGARQWVWFEAVGAALSAAGHDVVARVGSATASLARVRAVVDFASDRFASTRAVAGWPRSGARTVAGASGRQDVAGVPLGGIGSVCPSKSFCPAMDFAS